MRHSILVCSLVLLSCSVSHTEIWKDASGKISVEANLVKVYHGMVELEQPGGKRLHVPFANLHRDDLLRVLTRLDLPKAPNKGNAKAKVPPNKAKAPKKGVPLLSEVFEAASKEYPDKELNPVEFRNARRAFAKAVASVGEVRAHMIVNRVDRWEQRFSASGYVIGPFGEPLHQDKLTFFPFEFGGAFVPVSVKMAKELSKGDVLEITGRIGYGNGSDSTVPIGNIGGGELPFFFVPGYIVTRLALEEIKEQRPENREKE